MRSRRGARIHRDHGGLERLALRVGLLLGVASVGAGCASDRPGDPEDPCRDVTCSDHGTCVVKDGQPACDCEAGFRADGLRCVAEEVVDPCEGVGCSGPPAWCETGSPTVCAKRATTPTGSTAWSTARPAPAMA